MLKVIVAMEAGTSVVSRDLGSARSGRGRPRLEVDRNRLEFLRGLNFTWSEISTILGVSAKTLRHRAKDSLIYKYTLLSDSEIDGLIRAVLSEFPRSGEVMLSGHLKCVRVFIEYVVEHIWLLVLNDVRTASLAQITSGIYADGNHKLIKYRFVVHGAIDGFSRLITYLRCSDNNRASTGLDCFLDGVSEYGMPARIRTDKGGENVDIWQYMVDIRGENNHPYLAGSSVHNCRIERLWRDVRSSVLSTYLAVFNTLEGENVLDPNNETDLFCLHFIFVPRINEALKLFQQAWNSHSLSSEIHYSYIRHFLGITHCLEI